MNRLEKISIKGFKKFRDTEISFNESLSVFVGENESGKSTIFQAINIVINQAEFGREGTVLEKYFNKENIKAFLEDRTSKSLPVIEIQLYFTLESVPKNSKFSGFHYGVSPSNNTTEKSGITFKYEFDKDFTDIVNLQEFKDAEVLPIEYYKASWQTFQGSAYKRSFSPIKLLYLDNANAKNDLFGGYARQIFKAKIDEEHQRQLSAQLNKELGKFRAEHEELLNIKGNQYLGFDADKSSFVKLLDIFESEISIQDMGRGRENLIKTEMALYGQSFDVILVDEPEIHLSHGNTRKLIEFIQGVSDTQVILASHHSLIVSRLNLNNVIWVDKTKSHSLKSLKQETAKYFEKLDNLDILRFILSPKVILVEGHAEYICIPAMFKRIMDKSLDELGIDLISMGSISYNRYKEISELVGNKVLALTDNDEKENVTQVDNKFSVFAAPSISDWTFEVAMYNLNKDFFDDQYKNRKNVLKSEDEKLTKALDYMLKNKTNNALIVEEHLEDLNIPEYLMEAFAWISE